VENSRGHDAVIANCYARGNVSAAMYVGGLVGGLWLYDSAHSLVVDNCYSTGDVAGTIWSIGGMIGTSTGNSPVVSDCFSLGDVYCATNGVGTVVSYLGNGAAPPMNCFYNQNATYQQYAITNGTTGTTVAALGSTSHTVYHGSTAWDFTSVWVMSNGLPKLRAWTAA
jgi:hypothetical protein